MPVVTANDEPVKIAGPGDAFEEYDFQLEGNSLLVARSKENARDTYGPAKRIRKGDRGTLKRAPDESLWAYNDDLDGDGSDANLTLDRAGFSLNFGTRYVVGAVQTNRGNEAAPANDEDAHFYGSGVDVSGDVSTGLIDLPDATEALVVNVDDADDAFEVAVVFTDSEGNELTRRDSGNKSGFAGNSTTDVFASVEPAAPYAEVELSGAATSLDYTVYAR